MQTEPCDEAVKIRTALNFLLEPVLKLLQDDPHQWSTRPCPTCRTISTLLGKPFGCYLFAEQRKAGGK